jgi:two-component sensor histidine kinase
VVAELVTNSYDHAFPDGMGAIGVTVRRDPGNGAMARMFVRDNGQGFEPKSGSKWHGLGLLRRLAEQVRGTANVASSVGRTWTVDFPIPATEN